MLMNLRILKRRTLVINAQNLLASRMSLSGKDTYFCRRLYFGSSDNPTAVHARSSKLAKQGVSGLIFSQRSDEKRAGIKRGKIDSTVCATARRSIGPFVPENQHGRFARDTTDLAK
jgi:hypothetical protein